MKHDRWRDDVVNFSLLLYFVWQTKESKGILIGGGERNKKSEREIGRNENMKKERE